MRPMSRLHQERAMRSIVIVLALGVLGAFLAAAVNRGTVRGGDPLVVNTAITQDTESCYTTTSEISGFDLHSRGATATKVDFTADGAGTTYFTVPAGGVWSVDGMMMNSGAKICFQNAAASDTIEIVIWR